MLRLNKASRLRLLYFVGLAMPNPSSNCRAPERSFGPPGGVPAMIAEHSMTPVQPTATAESLHKVRDLLRKSITAAEPSGTCGHSGQVDSLAEVSTCRRSHC